MKSITSKLSLRLQIVMQDKTQQIMYITCKKVRYYVKICDRKHFALLFYNAGGQKMAKVFREESAEELHVQQWNMQW